MLPCRGLLGDVELPSDEGVEDLEHVDSVVIETPERWPADNLVLGRPHPIEGAYRNPKGVLRGWFEDAEDLEDNLARGNDRVVDAEDFIRGYAAPRNQSQPASNDSNSAARVPPHPDEA